MRDVDARAKPRGTARDSVLLRDDTEGPELRARASRNCPRLSAVARRLPCEHGKTSASVELNGSWVKSFLVGLSPGLVVRKVYSNRAWPAGLFDALLIPLKRNVHVY